MKKHHTVIKYTERETVITLQLSLIQQSKKSNTEEVSKIEIYGIELQVWLALGGAVAAASIWALKKYQKLNADGKITLDEIIGAIEEGEEYADKIVESAEDLSKALKSKKKAELVVIAEEKGLATTGTKADLIERITSGEE